MKWSMMRRRSSCPVFFDEQHIFPIVPLRRKKLLSDESLMHSNVGVLNHWTWLTPLTPSAAMKISPVNTAYSSSRNTHRLSC